VRKVNTALAGESSTLPGGVLNQSNFPEAPNRRWDDQIFENRLKQAISSSAKPTSRTTMASGVRPTTPRGKTSGRPQTPAERRAGWK